MSLWQDPKNRQWYSRHWIVDDGTVIRFSNANDPARKRRCWVVYGETKDRERADERISGLIQKETPEARLELSNKQKRGTVKQSVSAQRERHDDIVEMLKAGVRGKLKQWDQRLAKRTLIGYTQYLRLYISPTLGKLPMMDITWKTVLDLLQKLEVDERLGHNTLIHVRACLSTILTDAVSCGLLSLNPILGQQRKANRKHRQETVDPARPFNEEEKTLLEQTIRQLRPTTSPP